VQLTSNQARRVFEAVMGPEKLADLAVPADADLSQSSTCLAYGLWPIPDWITAVDLPTIVAGTTNPWSNIWLSDSATGPQPIIYPVDAPRILDYYDRVLAARSPGLQVSHRS
jgi:hypothetical protein